MNERLAVAIPALNPTVELIHYTKQLIENNFSSIIVVNDGSNDRYVFEQLRAFDNVTVLHHEVNLGKGRALKTAFQHCVTHLPHIDGVITADADGQHAIEDVCNVAKYFAQNETSLILGERSFEDVDVPKKSFIGNVICSHLFYYLFKKKLSDTQTGLRAIPFSILSDLIALKGERYEYEINMLIYAIKRNIPIDGIRIQTIYYNNNAGTYYKAIADSFKILKKLVIGFLHFNSQHHSDSHIGECK